MDLPLFLRMLRAAGEHTAEDLLSTIDVPVLVIAGERDTFTPLFLAEAMAKAMPKAELLVVKNGSHVAPLEQHDLVGEKIRSFLAMRSADRCTLHAFDGVPYGGDAGPRRGV